MAAAVSFVVALVATTAASAAPAIAPSAYQDLHWRMVGPFRGGRTRAVAGVPGKPNRFYMAPVNGGVWTTDDAGRTWRPIFDDQPTQSIGAIAVAPSNPDIIYVGSGEGLLRPDLSIGDGVYKSTDAGKTWTHLGLPDAQQIPKIVVDPRNPDHVFAAVLGHPYGPSEARGVFRSKDGGRTWTKVLYKDPNTGASDLEIDPQHPDTMYAALWEARLGPWEDGNDYDGPGGGLFKSTDGGATWRKLAGGLPANAVQLDVAIAPSRPSRLYVTLSTTEPADYGSGKGNGLYRSDDSGATWTSITTDERPMMKIGGGDLMVPVVDPRNPDVVYVASIVAMKSRDGGKTWTWLKGAPGGDDYQNLWISPDDPDTFLMVADQGAAITVNGGRTWSSWYNQPTAQLYHVGVSSEEIGYRICSGQQESGSACIASRADNGAIGYRDWRPVGAIEYGYAVPDPRNRDIVYGAGRNSVSRFDWATGQVQDVSPIPVRGDHRVERTQPLVFSPVRPERMYYAADVLFQSDNGGRTWAVISPDLAHPSPGVPASVGAMAAKDPEAGDHRGAIYAVAPSYRSVNTIWAGTDDGKVWRTRDGGKHWADITPPGVAAWSKVTQLDASRFDDNTAYLAISRLRVDDLAPYAFKTHDGGKTWTAITGDLPAGPVNAVRADPVRAGLLYAATETGVWVSFDDGAHWQSLQQNLPRSSARDVVVHGRDLIVATHGRGFWILDDVTPLRQLSASQATALFAPAPAYRMARSTYPDTPVPPDEPMAENPPTGSVIDYHLERATTAPITLEIRDRNNQVVRTFASTDPPELSAAEIAAQLIPSWWLRPARALATSAGMHRWIWDLRRARPVVDSYGYPISAAPHDTPRTPEGPRVAPGAYTVVLVVDGKRLTAPLEVRADPRTTLSRAALAQQAALELRLATSLTRSAQVLAAARSTLEQLAAPALAPLKAQTAPLVTAITALATGPTDPPKGARAPTLAEVTAALGGLYEATALDAVPTAVQLAETQRAERELADLAKRWDAIRTGELAALGAVLKARGLPEVHPERAPSTPAPHRNEE
ncbi:MAG: glycoside hydrolase [Deltaproteobacteria bacterium]|nr:glycoside hydrolase [Deltaproteobacteria bacterium]